MRREFAIASERRALAQAVMAAIEPLLDVLMRVGLTSPEAESLMRALFVHRARDWLRSQSDGIMPSDSRVALVTGVHRNFVRQILAQPPEIPNKREGRAYLPGRILRAWQQDLRYCDDSGKPRDLPEEGPVPSFSALAAEYLPGHTPTLVLQELLRSGAIESLAEHRVRIRTRAAHRPGIHADSVTAYARQVRALLDTLTARLLDAQPPGYWEATPVFELPITKMPIVREVLSRRAGSFLAGLEQELGREAKVARGKKVSISVTVAALEGPPVRDRRGRGSSKKR